MSFKHLESYGEMITGYTDAYIDESCVLIPTEHNCGKCGDMGLVYFDKETSDVICFDCLKLELEEVGYRE